MSGPRVAFFGSPAFALPVLDAIRARFEVVLVVAQPDKPVGRRLALTPPPVAARARELDLPLEQPARLKNNAAFAERLRASGADVAVTCAYGKILPAWLLEVPPHGFLNVHTSLLPLYRGAAPIQWAVIDGRAETGVTIMRTDPGLDTGPILLQEATPVGPDETAPELAARLSAMGAALIVDALSRLDSLEARPQDDARATLAPLLSRDDGRVRWADSARRVYDRYRGVAGWPGSFFEFDGRRVKVLEMRVAAGAGSPGEVLAVADDGVVVAAGDGAVRLEVVQPEARSRMAAGAWARGYGVRAGEKLA